MLDKEILNQYRNDAQGLARYFSEKYFKEHEKVFPINPFQVLTWVFILYLEILIKWKVCLCHPQRICR